MEKTFWQTTKDDVEVYVKKWFPDTQPKAVVQLAHGMVEHITRYDEFAEYLVDHNIAVYGNDHRGHGETGKKQGLLGYLADEDGFQKVSDDLVSVTKTIQTEYPDTPIFLFGHSMGSFLVRHYIQKYSDSIHGVILCGTGYFSNPVMRSGKMIAKMQPPNKESKIMNTVVFGPYNRRIKNRKTAFDWLSRDTDVVDEYLEDPLTGFIPTGLFFYDLMSGLEYIHDSTKNEAIRKDLPMLIMSGDEDPVGNYGKGVWKTARQYEKLGLTNIMTVLFKEARHELLHEINKKEVHEAIHRWIVNQL